MPRRLQAIAEYEPLHDAVLGLIVLNGLCMGAEAIPPFAELNANFLYWVFAVSQTVFLVEITIRVLAFWPRLGAFFRDSWNTFDFVVVALSLVPAVGSLVLTARLLRLLRLLRILSMSDTLRHMVTRRRHGALGLPIIGVTFVILNYILAIAGFHLFAEWSPEHWGDLGRSLTSLFDLARIRDVPAIVAPLTARSQWPLLYVGLVYAINVVLVGNALVTLVGARWLKGDMP